MIIVTGATGFLGRYLIDHLFGMAVMAVHPDFQDLYYRGRRPTGFYIPRFRNVTEPGDFHRGFGYEGRSFRLSGKYEAASKLGVGAEYKAALRKPGPWMTMMAGFGEMLPRPDNRVTLHPIKKDKWGIPLVHIDCSHGENDEKIIAQANVDAAAMLKAAGLTPIEVGNREAVFPGLAIHEMGTAHMGTDPNTSVLNKYNQAHDVPNLFITDGACMASSGCQNPSLTYMAMSARGAHYAAEFLRSGAI